MSSTYPFGIKPDSTRSAFEALGRRLASNVLDTDQGSTMEETSTAGEVRRIDGERFGLGQEIPLADIITRGERIELAAKQALHRRAGQTQHDIPENGITVRWRLEVEAVGFPRPPELQALFADIERDRDERRREVFTLDPAEDGEHIEPDPELIRIAEEAEEAWQRGLQKAVERYQRHVDYSVPVDTGVLR